MQRQKSTLKGRSTSGRRQQQPVSRNSSLKRVTFGNGALSSSPLSRPLSPTKTSSTVYRPPEPEVNKLPATTSMESFARRVKRAFRRRPEDYRELTAAIVDLVRARQPRLRRGRPDVTSSTAGSIDVLGRIERVVTLLDGHPGLVMGLQSILPDGYFIDIQPDAVVVKVSVT